jgi:hypothetical protein
MATQLCQRLGPVGGLQHFDVVKAPAQLFLQPGVVFDD